MTKPIRVTIDVKQSEFAYGVMLSAIDALEYDHALVYFWDLSPDRRYIHYTIVPERGAKPFVLRVLHEFAALCEE